MTASFVHRSLSLFKQLDTETKFYYKRLIGVAADATMMEIEKALINFERMKKDTRSFLDDLTAELEE